MTEERLPPPAGRLARGPVVHVSAQSVAHSEGGLGTHVAMLAVALARDGTLRQCVLSPRPDPGFAAAGVAWEAFDIQAVPPDSAALEGVLARVLAARPAPALVHVHNYEPAQPVLAALRGLDTPLVVTLHLPAPPEQAAMEARLLSRAAAVIAVSRSLRDEYAVRRSGRPPTVIPNGVDTAFFHPARAVRRLPERLLFAGRLAPQKGVDTVIRAVAELALDGEWRLIVAGEGEWRPTYMRLARDLGVGNRVEWLGWLPREALRRELWGCAALLMPSRYEPFGLSALEGMACGTPVVGSDVGGLAELVREGDSGVLVPPDSPGKLAAAVRELTSSPELQQRLSTAGPACAARLSWDRVARSTRDLYQTIGVEEELGDAG